MIIIADFLLFYVDIVPKITYTYTCILILKRGVATINAATVEEIFEERKELYEKYADFKADTTSLTLEESALKIASLFN